MENLKCEMRIHGPQLPILFENSPAAKKHPAYSFFVFLVKHLFMKRLTITFCAAVFLISCNNSSTTAEANKTDDTTKIAGASEIKNEPRPDSATMMKNWQAYMTPGKEHEWLASSNGTWTTEATMWMEPGKPPITSTGTATNKMVLGNRYQQSNFKGTMMGMPFEGMSTMAYDNAKKVYISTWVDNMGTGMMVGEGPWDEATKSVTLKGKMVDPGAGTGQECDFREVFRVVDNDHQVMEMYCPDPATGKEFKTMEIKFTRKK